MTRLEELASVLHRGADRETTNAAVDEIAALAAGGSRAALKELLRLILELRLAERPVRGVLMDPADVDDAVQATLIAVAAKISTFEGRSRFGAWIDRVARNEALQVVRRKTRKSEATTDQVPEFDPSARRLSSLVADEETFAALLAQLSPDHRTVLKLREEEGFSYEEIARRLDVPVGTVRSRINRARSLLAQLLVDAGHGVNER